MIHTKNYGLYNNEVNKLQLYKGLILLILTLAYFCDKCLRRVIDQSYFGKKIIITIRYLYLLTNARAIPIIILIKEKLCDITGLMYPEGKRKGQLWAKGPGGGHLASET